MKFKCDCGQTLATDDSAIGMTVECPTCKKRLKVPPAGASNIVVPPAEAAVVPEAPPAGLRAIGPPPEALVPPAVPVPPPPVLAPPPPQQSPAPVPVQPLPPPAQKPDTRSLQATIPLAQRSPVSQADYTADLGEEEEVVVAEAVDKSKNGCVISGLWDFSLTRVITPSLLKYLYMAALGLGALAAVAAMLGAFWGCVFAKAIGFWAMLWKLLLTSIALAVYVVLLRVAVEFTIAVFNIERHTRAMAQGGDGKPKKEENNPV